MIEQPKDRQCECAFSGSALADQTNGFASIHVDRSVNQHARLLRVIDGQPYLENGLDWSYRLGPIFKRSTFQ